MPNFATTTNINLATTTSINFEAKLGIVVVAKLIIVVVAKLILVIVAKFILVVVAKLGINVVAKFGIVVVTKFGADLGPSYVIEKLPVLGMSGKLKKKKQCIPKYLDPMLGRTVPEFKCCWGRFVLTKGVFDWPNKSVDIMTGYQQNV